MDNKFFEFFLLLGALPAMLVLAGLEKIYFEKISGQVTAYLSIFFGFVIFGLIVYGIVLLI